MLDANSSQIVWRLKSLDFECLIGKRQRYERENRAEDRVIIFMNSECLPSFELINRYEKGFRMNAYGFLLSISPFKYTSVISRTHKYFRPSGTGL